MVDAVRDMAIANVIAIPMAAPLIVVSSTGVEIQMHINEILNQDTIVTVVCVLLFPNPKQVLSNPKEVLPEQVHVKKRHHRVDVVVISVNVTVIKMEEKLIVVHMDGVEDIRLTVRGQETLDIIVTVVCVLLHESMMTSPLRYIIFFIF